MRILLLALLFAGEAVAVSSWLDTESIVHSVGLTRLVADWGPWTFSAIIGFATIFVTFAFLKNRPELLQASRHVADTPVSWLLLASHAASFALFLHLSSRLFGHAVLRSDGLALAWLVAGVAAIVLGALALVPWIAWRELVRSTGALWAYAAATAVLVCLGGNAARYLWQPAGAATFAIVRLMLRPLLPGMIADPRRMLLGTDAFSVVISPQCSGLEGACLMLGFVAIWLLLFRRECRFPQSLLLIPTAVVVSFLLNSLRIAALILIGNAGAQQVAAGGFHSQAGWILFNGAAVAFCLVVQRVPFFTTRALGESRRASVVGTSTAAYLLPFLAIVAAGMIATAVSAGFEWLYPLRFLAAGIALWAYRRTYAKLDWRCTWLGPAAGAAVFALWILLDRITHHDAWRAMPAALAAAPAVARTTWIACRVLAATVTVPLAEEIAFRGYLMRRLVSADFESVPLQRVTWTALLISSGLFGVLHGDRWIAGIVAGLLFGWLAKSRGRIGDAVLAHAVANACIAAYVLVLHDWHLW